MKKVTVDLSIIVPVMNEAGNITALAGEISRVMGATPWSWECVWVDDGSTDDTVAELRRIRENDSCHHIVGLTENFGQSAALAAGFRLARGSVIATLDGDGQNVPEDIPFMVNMLFEKKADMVIGWRRKRMDSAIKKLSSRVANAVRSLIIGDQVRDAGCAVRVFHRRCIENVVVFRGMHRFLPTLARINGHGRIVETPVRHRPRRHGSTKYGIHNRLWAGLADLLALCWMQRRMVYPAVAFTTIPPEEAAG